MPLVDDEFGPGSGAMADSRGAREQSSGKSKSRLTSYIKVRKKKVFVDSEGV